MVGDDGQILGTRTADSNKNGGGKQQKHLVVLPLKQRPKGDRVKGHVLEEVHVIAAAPAASAATSPPPSTARPGWPWRPPPGSKSASATIAKRHASGKRRRRYWPIRL